MAPHAVPQGLVELRFVATRTPGSGDCAPALGFAVAGDGGEGRLTATMSPAGLVMTMPSPAEAKTRREPQHLLVLVPFGDVANDGPHALRPAFVVADEIGLQLDGKDRAVATPVGLLVESGMALDHDLVAENFGLGLDPFVRVMSR